MTEAERGQGMLKQAIYSWISDIELLNSKIETTTGETRIVAEMEDNGMLHIFNENQLKKQ